MHTIYVTILVGLQSSRSSTPQLIFHNLNTEFKKSPLYLELNKGII